MEKQFDGSVFIGRFQPFHKGHSEIITHGLEISNKLLILIGSAESVRSSRNPFTYAERAKMILACFPDAPITIRPLEDYLYNDDMWGLRVKTLIDATLNPNREIALLGTAKDSETARYMMQINAGTTFSPVNTTNEISATKVREALVNNPNNIQETWKEDEISTKWSSFLPTPVTNFIKDDYVPTENYEAFREEYKQIEAYKQSWAKAPFPPSFYCCDYVLNISDHILVIERGINPGKGSLALPGGFVRQDESAREASVRELKEETQISLSFEELETLIRDSKAFDHPKRSLRGRTITNVFYGKTVRSSLPRVKADDDAKKAFWLPINQCYSRRSEFHDDHFHIINYFINQQ